MTKQRIVLKYTVELQWLEQAWDNENWFRSKVVPASQVKFLSRDCRDFNPLYGASAVGVSVLLFSFSIFSDRRSLK